MNYKEVIRQTILIIGAILGIILSLKGILWGIEDIWNNLIQTTSPHYAYSYSYTAPNPVKYLLEA